MRVISRRKIKEFRRKLGEKGIEVALFLSSEPIHDVNIEYFTGFRQTRFYSFSCLLFSQESLTLIVSPLSYERALKEADVDEVINLAEYKKSLTLALKEKLKGVKTIGILERIFPYKLYKKFRKLKFIDISDIILELRSVKEKKEVELIKRACRIANYGVKFIENELSRNLTEKELTLTLEQELLKKGADELAFPTIITSGKRSALVHPYPSFTDKKIQAGLGLVDFGVRYKGYCSDVTVPFSLGKLNERQKKMIKVVEEAYKRGFELLKVNAPTWKVHEEIEKEVERNGFEFKHSSGHGLGLELHDLPSLSPKPRSKEELKEWKEVKLKENMIFTLEPGVYVEGVGGCRLENDIWLTKNKPKVLTKSRFISL